MFKLKTTLAAVALSTALSGGIVGLGAATTTATANATTVTAQSSVLAHGGFGDWRRCKFRNWDTWNDRVQRGHRINRFKVKVNVLNGHTKFRHIRGCVKIRTNHHW